MSVRRVVVPYTVIIVFGFVLFLAASGGATRAQGQDAVRIAVGVDPVFTPWWIADRKGFFKKHGIQAEITQFSGGPDLADAVLAGQADFGSSGTATWMPRLARGSLVVLATMAKGIDNYKIAALTAVKSLEDLKGKKVGTVGGSSTDYLWDLVAKKLGTPSGGIELIAIPPPELVSSLDRGDVQAFFCWEPWPTKAVQVSGKDKVHLLAGSSDFGYYSNIILVANDKFVKAKPGATVRLLAAVRDATDYMNKDHAIAIEVGAAVNKLTPELTGYITDLYRYSLGFADDMVDAAKLEETWMRGKNQMKGNPIDWSKVADRQFVDQAKAQ